MRALRLAVSLLTVLPVGARTARPDRATAGRAMLAAPLVGLLLAVLVGVPSGLLRALGLAPLPVAVAAVAALAWLTRGLHLDGLADTADGLGAGPDPVRALAVMRQSDIGPFGVVTVVLVLLVQVTAGAQLAAAGAGSVALLAVVVGRAGLPLSCRRGVPAARPDGLGALVAGTVRTAPAVAAVAGCVVLSVAVALLDARAGTRPASDARVVTAVVAATLLALLGGQLLLRRCRRRVGGVTGDVLGAVVELTTAAYLLAAAALV